MKNRMPKRKLLGKQSTFLNSKKGKYRRSRPTAKHKVSSTKIGNGKADQRKNVFLKRIFNRK